MPVQKCCIAECDRVEKTSLGMCRKHYMRVRRNGAADVVRPPGEPGLGRSKHKLYRAWAGMVNRCYNPNHSSYARYGGAGVTVCDRWRADFLNFLADMGERPEGHSLDRIDPKGPYAPENCRWATASVQRSNISSEGDARMRAAMSAAVKARWDRWRAQRLEIGQARPAKRRIG